MIGLPRIGVAGWSLRRDLADRFGTGASQLARYATRFNCVEINSSFYQLHRPATYARWAEAVPDTFRFAVKMPRSITHSEAADAVLRGTRFARVAADPAPVPVAADTGGWDGLSYHRLHGNPRMYYSGYGAERLERLATRLCPASDCWIIFDNTALGEAIPDALWLSGRLSK
ncbi:DUF72 domain-containing protein [Lichenicola cladoniae]